MPPPRIIREFNTVIQTISRGRLVERLDEKLVALLEDLDACGDDKAAGSLTLTLKFQRVGERVEITPKVEIKPPAEKPVPPGTLFAVEGGLSVQHPAQNDMFSGPRGLDAASGQ